MASGTRFTRKQLIIYIGVPIAAALIAGLATLIAGSGTNCSGSAQCGEGNVRGDVNNGPQPSAS